MKHINFIKRTIKNKPDILLKKLHVLLKSKYKGLDISRQYLSIVLRDNNITRKRATFSHFPKTLRGKPRSERRELNKFFNVVKKFKLDDIISIDETSVSSALSLNYCRSHLGKRCKLKTDDNIVFRKYSLLVAIENKRCIKYELYKKGSVNGVRFNNFMRDICNKVKNKLFVLDNARIHKTKEILKIIKNSGNHVVYTVPYHPRLNTIEQFFNQIKHYIKLDKPMSFPKLESSLKRSIKKVKREHYKNYFRYAYDKKSYKNTKNKRKKSTKIRQLKKYKK